MKREDFLKRVRDALGRAENAPVTLPPAAPPNSAPQARADRLERFRERNEAALGKVHLVPDESAARAMLEKLLEGHASYCRTSHAILDELGLSALVGTRPRLEPQDADVGISGAEFAVAETGSVALSSQHGRLATLLPYHHVTVLRASQIFEDLNDLYNRLGASELPSAYGLHTGPSKSADIEQTMALGVHGPGRVDIIVLTES